MKKFLSMAIALVMVLSLTVVAFADTTVVSVDVSGVDTASDWDTYGSSWEEGYVSIADLAEIVDALNQEGSKLVLTITNTGSWFQVGFNCDPYAYAHSDDSDGANGHPVYTLEQDGDYQTVTLDGQNIYDILTAAGWYQLICGGEVLVNVSVTVPSDDTASAEEDTSDEASAEAADDTAEAEETTETVEETTSEEASSTSPATGVALALVPMAIAGIAVVSSKRR